MFILVPAIVVAAVLLSKSNVRLLPLLVIAALGTFVFRGALSWIVHPLAGLTLAFLASNIFSSGKRRSPQPIVAAVAFLLILSQLGAQWVVHPAGGLTLALLASVIFGNWRRELPTIGAAVVMLGVLSVLGAGWLVFPASGLALAWFATVLFSGELFGGSGRRSPAVAEPSPAALPHQSSGEQVNLSDMNIGEILQGVRDRVRLPAEKVDVPKRKRQGRAASVAAPPEPELEAGITGLLDRLIQTERGRLPKEVVVVLGELRARVQEAHAHLLERGLADGESGLLLRAVATDYAPSAVRAYLRLPASTANVTPLQDGKTGRDLLLEQLTLLLRAVRDCIADATRASGQDILAHQRFLNAKFGQSGAHKDFEV